MAQAQSMEFRAKVPGMNWEDIPICHKDYIEDIRDAQLVARTISLMNDGIEVRFNRKGSLQGYYVGPFLSALNID